ncbi:MAG: hypothetical protein NZM09_05515 [Ignavibacterium sp.]|nr:hypothetical protein [Ignavibacterium sp.]MDW8375135.1 hypothetical protein [Ignavibacteriales bacterium]
MKKIILIILVFFNALSIAQLKSITLFSDYSFAGEKNLAITRADAVGALVQLKFNVFENFGFSIVSGYKLYSLNEPNVLNTWNWDFWTNRYYPKIVSDLRADPNLSVEIGAIQKMDLIPLIFLVNYDLTLFDDLVITPSAGAGVNFYTRRMFATETWTKKFPQANYSFTYSYRNFAPDKKGNPFFAKFGLSITYNLLSYLDVSASSSYSKIFETKKSMGYDTFPFDSEFSINLGISFKY